eukprot:c4080_g2_i1.p1 GENE.c4080_g2_i1~~c4080_g2_i1.p1  ORF type:complete len:215 (-),score=24.86 c4080_g2_i1:308-952(-)
MCVCVFGCGCVCVFGCLCLGVLCWDLIVTGFYGRLVRLFGIFFHSLCLSLPILALMFPFCFVKNLSFLSFNTLFRFDNFCHLLDSLDCLFAKNIHFFAWLFSFYFISSLLQQKKQNASSFCLFVVHREILFPPPNPTKIFIYFGSALAITGFCFFCDFFAQVSQKKVNTLPLVVCLRCQCVQAHLCGLTFVFTPFTTTFSQFKRIISSAKKMNL